MAISKSVLAVACIVSALTAALTFAFAPAKGSEYIDTSILVTGELSIRIHPDVFCSSRKDRARSGTNLFSYSSDEGFKVFVHQAGNPRLLQISVYCNQTLADLLQPLGIEVAIPRAVDLAANIIVTQRRDVLRFLIHRAAISQQELKAIELVKLASDLLITDGLATAACYDFKNRCFLAVVAPQDPTASNEDRTVQAQQTTFNMLWIGLDAPSEEHLSTSRKAALWLLGALSSPSEQQAK